jgi:beta-glucanase (GH16 family)
MEHYGSAPGIIEGTVHTYAQSYAGQVKQPDVSENYHTYGVEVTPDNITWTIDGNPYHSFDKRSANTNEWPFGNGNRLYVILNLAMGGSGGGEISDDRDAWRMEVQNISFYSYSPN